MSLISLYRDLLELLCITWIPLGVEQPSGATTKLQPPAPPPLSSVIVDRPDDEDVYTLPIGLNLPVGIETVSNNGVWLIAYANLVILESLAFIQVVAMTDLWIFMYQDN